MQSVPGDLEQVMRHADAAPAEKTQSTRCCQSTRFACMVHLAFILDDMKAPARERLVNSAAKQRRYVDRVRHHCDHPAGNDSHSTGPLPNRPLS